MSPIKRRLALVTDNPLGEGSMKVAFTTEDMKRIDAHFGWARHIAVYEVSPLGYQFLEAIQFDGDLKEDGSEDKLLPKIDAIRDCAIIYVAAIGGSAAAKVVNAGVHPVKAMNAEPITEILDRLVQVLNGTPPPWLRKALMKGKAKTMDFEDEARHA
jgi:nitrogen fixation protein NifX